MRQMIRELIEMHRQGIEGKIEISLSLPPLPPTSEQVPVRTLHETEREKTSQAYSTEVSEAVMEIVDKLDKLMQMRDVNGYWDGKLHGIAYNAYGALLDEINRKKENWEKEK